MSEDYSPYAKIKYPAETKPCVKGRDEWDALGNPFTKQVGGDHYQNFAIQPIKFIMENKLDFCTGNAIKYLCRHKAKNGVEDLRKARQYIDFLIAEYVDEGGSTT